MSFKKYLAMMLTMVMIVSAFAGVAPSEAKKKTKTPTKPQTVTGCVVSGVAVQAAVSGSVVSIAEAKVPKSSASKKEKELEAQKKREAKAKAKIKAQKKAAKKKYKKALRLLAAIVYCEAGGQCYAGRLAVAAVVMNRVESKGYPNTIHGVLWQPYQFGPIRHGKMARELRYYDKGMYKKPERKGSLKAAKDILAGKYVVKYNGKKINLRKYTNFNGHLSNAKIRISGHDFA